MKHNKCLVVFKHWASESRENETERHGHVRLEDLRIIDNRDRGSKEKGITNSEIVVLQMKMANNCATVVEIMLV